MGKTKSNKSHNSEANEIEALNKQIIKARSRSDFKEVSNLHNRIGIIYRELRKYHEALLEHEEEVQLTLKHFPNDKIGLGVAYRAKAEVYLEMKEEEEALPLIKNYLRLSVESCDLIEEQRAHVTLGRVYLAFYYKYAESGNSKLVERALSKAEAEFSKARNLANSPKLKSSQSEIANIEMKCGVFLNISIVFELRENYGESIKFLGRAAELAKNHSLFDYLYRAHINLYEHFLRSKSYAKCIESIDTAISAAKSLENFCFEADAKLLKSKVLLKMNEVEGGMKLLKGLRKSIKNKEDFSASEIIEELEPLLKSAVRVIRAEDKLHGTSKENFEERKNIYEKLGDSYVDISNYDEAINNYQLAIENVKKMRGDTGKELGKFYFSIAETYKDLKDFRNAVLYYEKEILIHANNPAEALKTQTNITVALEKGKMGEERIRASYLKTIQLSKCAQKPKAEIYALKTFGNYLKSLNLHDESQIYLNEAEEMRISHGISGESEEIDSQDLLENGGSDSENSSIDLDALTCPNFQGDLCGVRKLIRQGHELNPRDSAGWIPLHEACNFGHLAVVAELLNSGARVNDQPSGRNCDKITPLHDAATNGHLDVVRVLIQNGANVLLKDAHGNYPIDSLIMCFANSPDISPEELSKFKEVKEMMRNLMLKGGKNYDKNREKRAVLKARSLNREDEPSYELLHSSRKGDLMPIKISVDDYDPDDAQKAIDLYSSTILNLRRDRNRKQAQKYRNQQFGSNNSNSPSSEESEAEILVKTKKIPALINETQVVEDDWLENDLIEPQKISKNTPYVQKRKFNKLSTRSSSSSEKYSLEEEFSKNYKKIKKSRVNFHINSSEESESESEKRHEINILSPEPSVNILITKTQENDGIFSDSNSPINIIEESSNSGSENNYKSNKKLSNFSKSCKNYKSYKNSDKSSPSTSSSSSKKSHYFENSSNNTLKNQGSCSNFNSLSNSKAKKVYQSSLLQFTKKSNYSDNFANNSNSKNAPISKNCSILSSSSKSNESNLSSFKNSKFGSRSSSSSSLAPSLNLPSVLRLKIKIGNGVYSVPVLESQLDESIEWLCEQSALRYYKANGVKPLLTLSTSDGALLCGSDSIRICLDGSDTNLTAQIHSYDLEPFSQRLISAASKYSELVIPDNLRQAVSLCESSNILNLSHYSLNPKLVSILSNALLNQFILRELDLSFTSIFNEGISTLAPIFPTLTSLNSLNLSGNGIGKEGISSLLSQWKKMEKKSGLSKLNLSFNSIGDSSAQTLGDLLSQMPHLKYLYLVDNDLTHEIASDRSLVNALENLQLEKFDISYNDAGCSCKELNLLTERILRSTAR